MAEFASKGVAGSGLGLGIAGMIYQTVFHNPLASPDIIGVSSGASAGAAFAISFEILLPICDKTTTAPSGFWCLKCLI